jgi:dipeptidyl aminopeptidase/acylaminoacyl peptidase
MKKQFDVQDLYLHRKVTELACHPESRRVAATVRSVDRENDKYLSCIWSFDLDGSAPAQLTRGPGRDNSPCWSPDGRDLAFVSDRNGGVLQVFILPHGGGEARQLTHFEKGVVALKWDPCGGLLYVTASVAADPDRRGRPGGKPSDASCKAGPEVAWRLPYKTDGVGYMLNRQIHLFSVDAESGKATQLTQGAFDVDGFDISRDGKRIAYGRTREGRFAHRTDLWVCDATGSGARQLTSEHPIMMAPHWSPDGRWIAFTGNQKEGDSQLNLWLLDTTSGRDSILGSDDHELADPESVAWSDDSRSLTYALARRGCHEIVSIAVAEGALRTLVGGARQFGACASNRRMFAYAVDTPGEPSEVHACNADGSGEKKLSDLNPWWRERVAIEAQLREFEVPDGAGGSETIQGWLLRAEGQQGALPLLNDVHGGPASYALLDFDTNVFWQVLCSRGWSVLALDAVGSGSYGRAFCTRLSGHWGELDLPQHLAAIRQLQQEGLAGEQVAISGKSYGGYLSAWAIGHTDMLTAAVVMSPVGNIETHYGTSDGGYYADPLYMRTAPHFDREVARALSPLQYVERAKTPTLFLQGKDDERCPKCQSEELFVNLMRGGETPAELVLYPGETHSFLGSGAPSCREDAARRIVDWLEQWCGSGKGRSHG